MESSRPDLLDGLAGHDAERVLALGSPVSLASGQELFGIGAGADSLFVIDRGRIALTLPMQVHGQEQDVLVEERLAGQTVGWSALIPPHRFTLKATATMDTEVIAFPRIALLDHFGAHPAVGCVVMQNIASVIGQRLQVFQAMWLREVQRAVEVRLA